VAGPVVIGAFFPVSQGTFLGAGGPAIAVALLATLVGRELLLAAGAERRLAQWLTFALVPLLLAFAVSIAGQLTAAGI
jgi:hypothetical protein